MDVTEWLCDLGLGQYEAAFRENAVSADLLTSLTADDLKDLGVHIVGHRRRLLNAIDALRAGVGSVADPSSEEPEAGLPWADSTRDMAERRQLSVMFCDIIGFTDLSSRLDPEDLSAVIRSYQANVAGTVARFGGFVARYVGDGVLVYFGWPDAQEADVEQAVRAGLAVVDAIGQAPVRTESLQVRIGIATGLVVVGEPIGKGDARQQTAIGVTPNVAARLQALAGPNGVVIDAATRQQIGRLFECRDLGHVVLKGLPEPVAAWQVLGESAVESRFEALRPTLSPLIGRDEEVELLLRRWRQAQQGNGQFVLLSGEPGIGKSRLIAMLEEQLRSEPHEMLRYFCSPHHRDSALYPVISRWQKDLGFASRDTPRERLSKLESALTPVGASTQEIALIADLLSVPMDDRYPPLDFNPQRKKEMTLEALLHGLTNLARRDPVLVLFEDAHWADASSIELLDKIIALVPGLPVLLIVSLRPEFHPPWVGLASVSLITLRRLTQQQTLQLTKQLVVEQHIPAALLKQIVAQSDGVPLFIEELTKTVLESSEKSASTAGSLAVPTTLQASLIARLDRLSTAKPIAQIGAVIGRDFGHRLLAAVAEMPEARLVQCINALIASGLAFQRGLPPDADYTFKHALVREAAYGTLLRSQRQELHGRIGKTLEEQFPEIVKTQPEILAHHFAQAGVRDRASEYHRHAGLRFVGRSAYSEAAAHFEHALDQLRELPLTQQRDAQELDILLELGVCLRAQHGTGSPRLEECASRARGLADRLPTSSSTFSAHRLVWNTSLHRQSLPRTVMRARELLDSAGHSKIAANIALAHRALGYSLMLAGEFPEANEALTQSIALADTVADHEFYGDHPGISGRNFGGQLKALMGFPESAERVASEALTRAIRLKDAFWVVSSLLSLAEVYQAYHDAKQVARFASEAIDMARDNNLPQWLANGEQCLGWAMHRLGDLDAGMELQLQGVKRWTDIGSKLHETYREAHLADSFIYEGKYAEARVHLDAARTHCTNYGEAYLAPEIHRLEGVLLQHEQAPLEVIEGYLIDSLNSARLQGARLFELRTATTLARMLTKRGERRQARCMLTPIYEWFTEGFEAADLNYARALLDELG